MPDKEVRDLWCVIFFGFPNALFRISTRFFSPYLVYIKHITPNEAVINGSVRCHDAKVRASIPERIDRIVGGVACGLNCSHKLDYIFGIPPVANDAAVMESFASAARETLGENNVVSLERPLMGSEDFAFFLEKIPTGGIFRLGVGNAPGRVLHNPMFDFPDEAIVPGVAAMTAFALKQCQ